MATKKAKKTSKKSVETAPKVTTTTKVVTKAAPSKKPSFFQKSKELHDIDSLFSAKTISLLFVEMIGAMIMTLVFSTLLIKDDYLAIAVILTGLGIAFSSFAIAFFNPIFAFGAWIANKISTKKAVLIVIAQVLGTMLAVILMTTYLKAQNIGVENADTTTQATIFKMPEIAKNKEWFVFFAEMLAAAIICCLASKAANRSRTERAVVVGLATFVGLFVARTLLMNNVQTVGIANPAMSIALINFTNDNWQWHTAIYVVAPLVGGGLAFLIDKILVRDSGVKTTIKEA